MHFTWGQVLIFIQLPPRHIPRAGRCAWPYGRVWKFFRGKFQRSEVLRPKVPNLGRFSAKSSKVWKFLPRKFQSLEVFTPQVPRFGSFYSKSSKVARPLWGRGQPRPAGGFGSYSAKSSKAAPTSVGAGLEVLWRRIPGPGSSAIRRRQRLPGGRSHAGRSCSASSARMVVIRSPHTSGRNGPYLRPSAPR